MSIRRNILPFCLAMVAQGYDIRSAGYTQCTGRGNESKPPKWCKLEECK